MARRFSEIHHDVDGVTREAAEAERRRIIDQRNEHEKAHKAFTEKIAQNSRIMGDPDDEMEYEAEKEIENTYSIIEDKDDVVIDLNEIFEDRDEEVIDLGTIYDERRFENLEGLYIDDPSEKREHQQQPQVDPAITELQKELADACGLKEPIHLTPSDMNVIYIVERGGNWTGIDDLSMLPANMSGRGLVFAESEEAIDRGDFVQIDNIDSIKTLDIGAIVIDAQTQFASTLEFDHLIDHDISIDITE